MHWNGFLQLIATFSKRSAIHFYRFAEREAKKSGISFCENIIIHSAAYNYHYAFMISKTTRVFNGNSHWNSTL